MKVRLLAVAAILMCCFSVVMADEDDDTLRFYLSKSSIVISGEITSSVSQMQLEHMTYYSFDLKVVEVAKGKLPEAKSIHVTINRTERYEIEESALLKEAGT
jgi:hypothetical protein